MTEVGPRAVTTGMTESESAKAAAFADKPMLIYVTADDQTDKVSRKLSSVVFANENVAVGTKFFKCVKMTTGNSMQDRLIKDAGKYTPRLVLVGRDYKVIDVLQKKGISSGKLLKAMKRTVRREYKSSFDKMVRGYIKLLNNLDRLDGRRAAIADGRARLAAKPSKSKEKKLARKEAELNKDMEAWGESEKKLLELKKREPKGVKA